MKAEYRFIVQRIDSDKITGVLETRTVIQAPGVMFKHKRFIRVLEGTLVFEDKDAHQRELGFATRLLNSEATIAELIEEVRLAGDEHNLKFLDVHGVGHTTSPRWDDIYEHICEILGIENRSPQ